MSSRLWDDLRVRPNNTGNVCDALSSGVDGIDDIMGDRPKSTGSCSGVPAMKDSSVASCDSPLKINAMASGETEKKWQEKKRTKQSSD